MTVAELEKTVVTFVRLTAEKKANSPLWKQFRMDFMEAYADLEETSELIEMVRQYIKWYLEYYYSVQTEIDWPFLKVAWGRVEFCAQRKCMGMHEDLEWLTT